MFEQYFKADSRIQTALDRVYVQQLKRILAIGSFYYFVIGLAHFAFLAPEILAPLATSAFSTVLVSVIILYAVHYGWLTPRQTRYAFIPTAILGSFAVFLHVELTGDILQLTNNALIIFSFGMTTLSARIFIGFLSLNIALYLCAMLTIGGPLVGHFSFLLFGAIAISIMGFIVRYKAIYSAEELALENAEKNTRLTEANKQIERKHADAEKAVEEARKANIAKDAFLANTTHELRTPLTGVLGMLDVLGTTDLSKEQQEAVDAAQFSARSLLVIINDLLDIAKIEAGKFEFRIRDFDPERVLQHVKELLVPKAKEKGNHMFVGPIAGDAGLVLEGDPVRVGQVLFNLMDNAIKFTEKAGVTVFTTLRREGDYANFTCVVKDEGIGFAEEHTEKLFQRFGQIDDTSTTQTGGTGLGLPISRELARLMDGDIMAVSDEGKGAEFTFTAKFKVSENQQLVDPSVKAEVKPEISKTPLRILVAEDVIVNQLLLKKMLAKHAWQLEFANDGVEAIKAIEANEPYDLIFMDIRMPNKDGKQVIHEVQGMDAEKASVPIIALTANAGPEDSAHYLRIGAAAVVGKPIRANKLAEAVNRLINLKG